MKKNGIISLLGITILLLAFLAGCTAIAAEQALDTIEETIDQQLEIVEDAVGAAVIDILTTEPPSAQSPAAEASAAKLTADEAKAIALEHAGFTADQATRLRAEYDWDDGVPVYEVQFHQDRWEYDYDIHAETGKILSYDRDD